MAYQIIRQPDGQLAVFTTVSDMFAMIDASEQDVIDLFVDMAKADAERNVRETLDKIRNDRPRPGFIKTFAEALEIHRRNKSDDDDFNAAVEAAAIRKTKPAISG